MSLCQPVIWSVAALLCDSTVAAVVRTRPRAIPLAMITMRNSTHGFSFVSHIWVAYGAPLGGPSGRPSSANISYGSTCQWPLNFLFKAAQPFSKRKHSRMQNLPEKKSETLQQFTRKKLSFYFRYVRLAHYWH